MTGRLDIAVVGAGPAGLAAALFLARSGHRVFVLERFAAPKPVGSGLILQPTGLAVLEMLGLLPAITSLGARIERLHGTDASSGRTVLDVRYNALPGNRFGLAVHRAALFQVLHDAVVTSGIEIRTDTEAASLDASGARAILLDPVGRKLGNYDLVVDASGARSRLRAASSRPSEPTPLAYGALWASLDWCDSGFDPHALQQRYLKASVMVGVLPIGRIDAAGGRKAAFFWSLKPADMDALVAQGLHAWKDSVAGLWPACQPLLDQIGSFDALTLARYGHHTLRRPVGRRLAVIGDAAHSTSPQLGQGANMALLDAAALAAALERAPDVETALDMYVRSRSLHVRTYQALSRVLTPFYQSDSAVLSVLRDTAIATIARVPPAPRLLAAMVAGTLVRPIRAPIR